MQAEGLTPRDQADALAEAKARRIAHRHPAAFVLGCDQVLDLDGTVLAKPEGRDGTRAQLLSLAGRTHRLFSAAVIVADGGPIWRHIGETRLTMRPLEPAAVDAYLDRTGGSVIGSLGGYKLEEQGSRLFSSIAGDYFSGLGLPLLPLLSFLIQRGVIEP